MSVSSHSRRRVKYDRVTWWSTHTPGTDVIQCSAASWSWSGMKTSHTHECRCLKKRVSYFCSSASAVIIISSIRAVGDVFCDVLSLFFFKLKLFDYRFTLQPGGKSHSQWWNRHHSSHRIAGFPLIFWFRVVKSNMCSNMKCLPLFFLPYLSISLSHMWCIIRRVIKSR